MADNDDYLTVWSRFKNDPKGWVAERTYKGFYAEQVKDAINKAGERVAITLPQGKDPREDNPGHGRYVVTGLVKSKGKRDTISQPMDMDKAQAFADRLAAEIKDSIPAYQWVSELKVEPSGNPGNPNGDKEREDTIFKWLNAHPGRHTAAEVMAKTKAGDIKQVTFTLKELAAHQDAMEVYDTGKGTYLWSANPKHPANIKRWQVFIKPDGWGEWKPERHPMERQSAERLAEIYKRRGFLTELKPEAD